LFAITSEGKKLYSDEIESRLPSVLDLLNQYKSVRPPLDHLLDVLPPQGMRYYSVGNFPQYSEKNRVEIHFAFTVVKNNLPGFDGNTREFRGISSNWLKGLVTENKMLPPKNDDTSNFGNSISEGNIVLNALGRKIPDDGVYIPIFPRTNIHFRYPEDPTRPIIMVAAGTGISPFLGFLQYRKFLQDSGTKLGPCWLFYGCRHPQKDFLYPELYTYSKDELVHLKTAFSREIEGKVVYVQNHILENGEEVSNMMLSQNGVFYVCGDAIGMVKGVRHAMVTLLQKYGSLSEADALETLKTWAQEKKYLLDIWN